MADASAEPAAQVRALLSLLAGLVDDAEPANPPTRQPANPPRTIAPHAPLPSTLTAVCTWSVPVVDSQPSAPPSGARHPMMPQRRSGAF
ncbi:hypothetical protein [Microbacterium arborescens]|uniref:hypothetical protein n=1 Tax=Microbacterium arborescens TaxID=33883 RepID=UPI002782B4A0|nr:hypothetical protein [Microbacterium arborescens]MDQ1217950.1 hypothetical protein [Microbacterium arborescens]